MPSPHPPRARFRETVDHPERLRVVDDDEVVVVLELLCVQLLIPAVDLLLLVVEPLRVSLQCVVDRLRDVVELLGAANDPPLGFEAGVLHQRDERVVDLRDAAPERRCGQVDDTLTGERLGEATDLLHQATRGDRRVIRERLVSDVDELQQGCADYVSVLMNRRREPFPLGRDPISTSSAIARMIAIPSPPSAKETESAPPSPGSKPAPSSATSITSRSGCSS